MKRGKTKKSVKKKVNSSKCKPFLDDKKLVAIVIATFFIFAFLLAFVNVPQNATVTGQATDGGFISDLFTDWSAGNLDVNIAKYLFFFMLTMLIFSVLNFAKFPPKIALQFLIALPVGFLATAYITPDEIFTILTSYSALGIVLSFLLPFIIMLFFSAMLVSNEKIKHMSMPKIMLEVFLWFFFVIVMGYKLIMGVVRGEALLGLNLPLIIMIGIFFISCLILIFNKTFRNWMWKIGNDVRKAKEEASRVSQAESEKTKRKVVEATEEETKKYG